MGEWARRYFGELVNETKDGDWGQESMAEGFVPFHVIRGTDFEGVRRGNISAVPLRYLPERTVWRRMLQPGDLLLETAGGSRGRSTGRSLLVDQRTMDLFPGPVTCASFARFLRIDPAVADSRYIYWFLQHLHLSGAMWQHQVQHTGVARFQYTRFAEVQKVFLPPLAEQRAIAEVLGALDDKIVLNERTAVTARQLCRALMQAMWAEGGISSLTDWNTELRQGWRRTSLGQLCAEGAGAIQTGPFGSQLHASDYVQSGIPSVMPQNIGDNVISEDGIARITGADADRLSKYLLAEGDIVYSRRGDVKRRALVREHEAGWLCGTGCLRVRVGASTRPLFISYYLGEPEIQDWVAQHAVGATMPNLNTSILGEVPVVLPPVDVVDGVHERLAALDRSAVHVTNENSTLADLRDTLLPQLVTGKLRVKDAIRVVEEAV
ncbi:MULTISPECIES: restriction endonuclease subunit S [Streptomyces]|uniref:restriction endonuclease subunit S n=1 Tax=Streptomyces TaxID=1883 RepID=UPI000BF02C21|nr:restriction endonuclease subunit S [Streptomyces sp. wa1063]